MVLAFLVAVAACGAASAGEIDPRATKDGWRILVEPDHAGGLYRSGETIRFLVRVTRDDRPVAGAAVSYEIELNGTRMHKRGDGATDKAGALAVETSLGEPGCLAIVARCAISEGQSIASESGVAVDAPSIKPALPAPDDFDAFWAAQKKRLAEMPRNARLTPVEVPREGWEADVECFDVQIDCPGGAPMSGYFGRPKGAAPRSCPAWISFHGAGVHSSNLMAAAARAKTWHMLGMDINAHGSPNGKPDAYYKDLQNGRLRGYGLKGIDSRDTCYFLGMYLRIKRALDFLCEQPEWDGKTLIAAGSSQGGGQAIVAAGLDERVSIISAGLPALCDLAGSAAERGAGWPFGTRKLSDEQLRTVRYFDACHFAARTRARAVVRVGLVDHTCWPTGMLAMCNQLKGTKDILIFHNSGHGWTPSSAYRAAGDKFNNLLAGLRKK